MAYCCSHCNNGSSEKSPYRNHKGTGSPNLLSLIFSCCCLILFLLAVCCVSAGAVEPVSNGVKRVLLISSFSSGDPWTDELMQGVRSTVYKGWGKVSFDIFELDILSQPGVVPAEEDIAALEKRLAERRFDLIIAENNAAADLFLSGRLKPYRKTPLLLMGYHGKFSAEQQRKLNMTGVLAAVHPYENACFGQALLPDSKTIILVIGASSGGPGYKRILELFPPELRSKLTLVSGEQYTTAEMLKLLGEQPPNSFLLFNSWSSLRDDVPVNSYQALAAIRGVFPGLILGRFDSYIPLGSSGGCVASGFEQGRQAGKLALRILNGEKASGISPEKGGVRFLFNQPDLAKFHIRAADIPAGTELINVQPDFFQRHYVWLITTIAVLMIVLASFIAYQLFLRMAQKKMVLIFKYLPVRIGIFDRSGRARFHHSPDLPDEKWPTDLTRLDQLLEPARSLLTRAVNEVFQTGKPVELDYEENGRFRHGRFLRLPPRNPFHAKVVLWISNDQTELCSAQRATAEVAEHFRLTLESIGDGVVVTDPDKRITLLNPVAEALTGYSRLEARGKMLDEVFCLENSFDGKPVQSPLDAALRQGRPMELTEPVCLIDRHGKRRHIADSVSPIRDDLGTVTGAVLIFRDVSEDYRKQNQLQLHSAILKTVCEREKFRYFRCDSAGRLLGASEDASDWPYRSDGGVSVNEWVLPEYRTVLLENWHRLVNGDILEFFVDYAGGDPEHPRYFELRVMKFATRNDRSREFIGLVQDVSATREKEFRYRDNLSLLQTILDNAPGYVFVKNANDNFRYLLANRKFCELVGADSQKIIGNFDRDIFSVDRDCPQRFRDEDCEAAASEKTQGGRDVFINNHGTRLAVQTVKSVLTRSDGTRLLIGMGLDISKQYELELELKRSIDTLNRVGRNERIINQSLTRITLEPTMERAVNEMLRIIGENVDADRCYIFHYLDREYNRSRNDYEWTREGIEPQIDRLQNQDMSESRGWTNLLLRRQEIIVEDMDHPPIGLEQSAIDDLKLQSIKSLLVTGLWVDDRLYGFVGFDFVRTKQQFTENSIHTVHNIANLFLLTRERFRQLEAIADSVSLQRQIVDNITIPVVLIDLNYKIVTANPRASADCGLPVEYLTGLKCYDLLCRSPEPPDWCPVRQTLQDSRMHTCEAEIFGCKKIVTSQPIFDRHKKLMYVLKSDFDVTDLYQQKQKLQSAVEAAQAADRAKSYFLATMSHEIRTPLNAVIGFSELLRQGNVKPEEHDAYLESIQFAGTALLNLINDVLDLSKLEAEQMDLHLSRVNVAAMVGEITSIFRLKANEKNLELKVDCSELRTFLYVDNQRLRQVLLNLIGNAFKFTHEGGVTVSAKFTPDPESAASGADRTGTLRIAVADTGIGIGKKNLERIFEPFVQAEETTRGQRAYEGSGLGLAISKRLVEKMNGNITAVSRPEKGSTFVVQLDQVRFEGTIPGAGTRRTGSASACQLGKAIGKYRLLLVDDVSINLKVLAAMLKKLNIDSDSVTSGREALERLRKGEKYEAVLSDLWMPGMSGVELARQIRESSKLPVFAVTADAQLTAEMENVFDGVLLKPVTFDTLREALSRYCRFEQPKGL